MEPSQGLFKTFYNINTELKTILKDHLNFLNDLWYHLKHPWNFTKDSSNIFKPPWDLLKEPLKPLRTFHTSWNLFKDSWELLRIIKTLLITCNTALKTSATFTRITKLPQRPLETSDCLLKPPKYLKNLFKAAAYPLTSFL